MLIQKKLGEFEMKRRLQDLDKSQEEEALAYIRNNFDVLGEKQIIEDIKEYWDLDYKPSSVKYLLSKAKHPEFLDRLQEENEQMKIWMDKIKTIKKVNYADLLNDLANKLIDQEDFNKLVKHTGVKI